MDTQAGPPMKMIGSTEAFLPGSDTPVLIRPGHAPEDVKVLSREEFQRASALQKQRDAEQEMKFREGPVGELHVQTKPKAPSAGPRSGKRSPGRPRTLAPKPLPDKTAELEGRMSKLEDSVAAGFDRLACLMAGNHTSTDIPEEELEEPEVEADDEEFEVAEESVDLSEPVEWDAGDPALNRMQAFIKRKTPLKDFRRFWYSLCPRAGFQEWPSETQERFTQTFNTVLMHPKFLHQVRRTTNTFHNGQTMGEEQMYKMLLVLAGSCALYSIITAENA